MYYSNPKNILRQLRNFKQISNLADEDSISDVYVRCCSSSNPSLNKYWWYVGKMAHCTGVCSRTEAVLRQWDMIVGHACGLRPKEFGAYSLNNNEEDEKSILDNNSKPVEFELWLAPGDTILDVGYNLPSVRLDKVMSCSLPDYDVSVYDYSEESHTFIKNTSYNFEKKLKNMDSDFCGFEGEVYIDGQDGFCTERTSNGYPLLPEIERKLLTELPNRTTMSALLGTELEQLMDSAWDD